MEYKLVKKPKFTGKWGPMANDWQRLTTQYLKEKHYLCDSMVHTYCLCAKQTTMCEICFGNHMIEIKNTSKHTTN